MAYVDPLNATGTKKKPTPPGTDPIQGGGGVGYEGPAMTTNGAVPPPPGADSPSYTGPAATTNTAPPSMAAPDAGGGMANPTAQTTLGDPTAAAPGMAPPAAAPAAPMSPQDAAAAGLGWVPPNHPLYGTPGYVGSQAATAPASMPGPISDGGPMLAPPAPASPDGGYTGPAAGTPEGPIAPTAGKPADPTAPGAPTATDPNGAYKSALLRMLDQASTPASLNDPALKAQSDAAAVGLSRSTDAGRAALAERMAQQGGAGVDSGAFNSDLAGLFNSQGESQAGINAGLVGDANKQKVQQLQSALTMMGNDINSEQGRALARELQQAQLAETSKEFEANYGLEGKRLAESMRQFDVSTQAGKDAALQQLTMFKQQMAEQGRQFDVDAAMKKLGIQSQTDLGSRDLALRDKLGSGGLNAQILQMLMQQGQFDTGNALDLGKFNSSAQNANLQALLQQLGA